MIISAYVTESYYRPNIHKVIVLIYDDEDDYSYELNYGIRDYVPPLYSLTLYDVKIEGGHKKRVYTGNISRKDFNLLIKQLDSLPQYHEEVV